MCVSGQQPVRDLVPEFSLEAGLSTVYLTCKFGPPWRKSIFHRGHLIFVMIWAQKTSFTKNKMVKGLSLNKQPPAFTLSFFVHRVLHSSLQFWVMVISGTGCRVAVRDPGASNFAVFLFQNGFDYLLTYSDNPQTVFPRYCVSWMVSSGKQGYAWGSEPELNNLFFLS